MPKSRPQDESHSAQLLILCQLFYPELVSTGQTLTELAEQLAARGVDVEVLCGPPTVLGREKKVPKRMEHQGIRIRRVWGTRFLKLSLVGRVLNQLTFTCSAFLHLLIARPRKPILVLTNPPFLALGCALLRRLGLGSPYLYLVFDVYPDTAIRLGLLRDGACLARLWDRLNLAAYRHASAIIVIGRCMGDVIARKLRQGGLPVNGKLHHIPVWCDDEAIGSTASTSNGLDETWGLQDKFVVGYFGNMGRFHDMETIMGAAELLKDERDIVFLFVGEGHKKQWAIQWARAKGLGNCQFHGYVAREELGHLLALADVGLVSLLDGQEGLSVPSKTYGLMAAGVPVLAVMSGISEVARMVDEVSCGVWVHPGAQEELAQEIRRFRGDPRRVHAMGVKGRRAIDHEYSLEHIARQYLDIVAEVSIPTQAGRSQTLAAAAAVAASRGKSPGSQVPIRESQTLSGGDMRQAMPSGQKATRSR
ncbi:MAG: glycosyltransferase family 4 protein [Phycisphaerales bacterium]|nr:MAG: glycosyltransferase family 4 protein [Phycisphaerales bacterium]